MIYTITFNPSLDYTMIVDKFDLGETNRSSSEEMYPGGKGFNVSTILKRLDIDNTALGFIAGFTGKEIEKQLLDRDIKADLIELDKGMSRINVKMKGQYETEINASGPDIPQDKLDILFDKIDLIQDNDILILAGSIPPSLPDDIYQIIMKRLENKKVKIIVDATNQLLLKVLPYKPFLIKPNHRELEEIFNTSIHSQEELIGYATQLQEMGAVNVLVSLGKDGALLVTENHNVYTCDAAKGKLVNSVGSGDSMVAGFIAGYMHSHDYKEAIRLGSACGGATAFSADLAERETIDEVLSTLTVHTIK